MKPYKLAIVNSEIGIISSVRAKSQNPRLKNWKSSRPVIVDTPYLGGYDSEQISYRGSARRYIGFEYFPVYTSRLNVYDKYNASYDFFDVDTTKIKSKKLRCPKGTEWDADGSIVQSSNFAIEYHPTSKDMMSKNFGSRIIAALMSAKIRREKNLILSESQLEYQRIMDREIDTTRVNLEDSRMSGNCLEGSLRYAERMLRTSRESILIAPWLVHFPTSSLDPDKKECQRAIRQAWLRETTVSI